MVNPKIRTRIAELRKQSGMTQAQLAEYLDMTIDGLANWERGRISFRHLETIIKLCDLFNCPPHDLLEDCSIIKLKTQIKTQKPIEPEDLQELRTMLGTSEAVSDQLKYKQEAQE